MSSLPPRQSGSSVASKVLPHLLAFAGAFVDTAGFILLSGLFLAHVTGNFVVLGAHAGGQAEGSIGAKLLVLPLFVLAVAVAWMLARKMGARGGVALAIFETAALVACAVAGVARARYPEQLPVLDAVFLSFGVVAMGVQAMLGRVLKLPMTTVMTGNVVQVTADALEFFAGDASKRAALMPSVILVVAFAGGALCAGFGLRYFGAWALFVPVAVLCVATAMLTLTSHVAARGN